jgi:GNAT superfamily N-acetyltransferase
VDVQIVRFEPNMASGVAQCYNDLIEPVPECYPVLAERFRSLAALSHRRMRDEEIMVARADGDVVGFVHVGIALPAKDDEEPKGEPGVIRFLSYRVGQRGVGQALLEWAEGWMRERQRDAVVAWEAELRYPFYHFGYAHLSERIGHVRGLLGMNGYREMGGELYFTWPDFTPPQVERPPFDFDLKAEWREGPSAKWLSVVAMQGEAKVGHCNMDLREESPAPEAKEWCYCDALWVTERLQRKRLGTFLLATALDEMRKTGCKHAAISTGGTNYRAQLMYANMGFQVVDYTVVFRKELEGR